MGLPIACAPPAADVQPPPPNTPTWSSAKHIHWAPVSASGERMLVIDVSGGVIDQVLHDADVATVLNDRFETVFLHPAAAPAWTERVGWPSMTALGPDCRMRAHGRPTTPTEAVALANTALRDRAQPKPNEWPALASAQPPPLPEAWVPPGPVVPCKSP